MSGGGSGGWGSLLLDVGQGSVRPDRGAGRKDVPPLPSPPHRDSEKTVLPKVGPTITASVPVPLCLLSIKTQEKEEREAHFSPE